MDAQAGKTGGSFWTSLPGLLTAVAALVTAVVGAVALFHQPGSRAGGTAATPAVSTAGPASDTAIRTSPSASGSTPVGTPPINAAMITLMPRDWLDVETGSSGTSVIGGDLIWVSGQLDLYGSHHAIVPNSALVNGRADQAGCIALMQKRSDGYVTRERLAQGVVVCIATTEGSVAELRITPPDIHDALQVELTTWR